jgi:mono/diheme cytochrome c family protein
VSRRTTILTWLASIVLVVAVCGFLAFLYFVPPFLTASPESFSGPVAAAAPPVASIADPAERAIAERGREIVMRSGCIGCHATNGAQGPDYTKYLAGGGLRFVNSHGTFVSRNLTPDSDTGLGQRTDEDIKRVLRSGLFRDGHVVSYTVMPWAEFSNWTEEDRHAVVVYLRHLPSIRHDIPPPDPAAPLAVPGAIEEAFGGQDYGRGAAAPGDSPR